MMDAIRRDVGDRVELAPGERLLERGELPVDLVLGAERGEPLRVDIDTADDVTPSMAEKLRGMLVGHAAGAENEQAHDSPPPPVP